jgi:hypothetical protein
MEHTNSYAERHWWTTPEHKLLEDEPRLIWVLGFETPLPDGMQNSAGEGLLRYKLHEDEPRLRNTGF